MIRSWPDRKPIGLNRQTPTEVSVFCIRPLHTGEVQLGALYTLPAFLKTRSLVSRAVKGKRVVCPLLHHMSPITARVLGTGIYSSLAQPVRPKHPADGPCTLQDVSTGPVLRRFPGHRLPLTCSAPARSHRVSAPKTNGRLAGETRKGSYCCPTPGWRSRWHLILGVRPTALDENSAVV
ncbi:unnamed protein product [Eretmochelys imbricata]